MATLRTPVTGCPWDLEQNFKSIAPYTIEEAYEVADAIDRNDMPALKEELGDLLLQVAFHSRMAEECGAFNIHDVIDNICTKMRRRHPHVFLEENVETTDEVSVQWEDIKARERAGKMDDKSVLADIAVGFPALLRAQKLQKRAARTGFDWPDTKGVLAKVAEEMQELVEAENAEEREEEMGDLLFVMVNLCRHMDMDAETALKKANAKFERRFRAMETDAGIEFEKLSLDEKEVLWNKIKVQERSSHDKS